MRCTEIPWIEIFRLKTHEGYSCKLLWNKIYSHQFKTRQSIRNCLPSLEKMTIILFHFILSSPEARLFSYHLPHPQPQPRPHQRSLPQPQLHRLHPHIIFSSMVYYFFILLLLVYYFLYSYYFLCMKKVNWVCNLQTLRSPCTLMAAIFRNYSGYLFSFGEEQIWFPWKYN